MGNSNNSLWHDAFFYCFKKSLQGDIFYREIIAVIESAKDVNSAGETPWHRKPSLLAPPSLAWFVNPSPFDLFVTFDDTPAVV